MPSKVLDIDLAEGLSSIVGLAPYGRAFVLARWRGKPVGTAWLDVDDEALDGRALLAALFERHGDGILEAMASDLVPPSPAATRAALPTATVAVCTRDRPEDLARCLATLTAQSHPASEIIIVDNAPSDSRTRDLCAHFPVRYVREDIAGLNWARRRAVLESRSEIVAFTDDDAAPDPGWLEAMLRPFETASVAATSGLALPLELETEGQEGFEQTCPMSRGLRQRSFDGVNLSPLAAAHAGLGASMAIRRELADRLGLFAVDLDAGTAAKSGGDTYAFYRLLQLGHRIVYTPEALIWHRHRRTRQELVDVLRNYSIGTYVFLLRCLFLHGEFEAIPTGIGWFLKRHVKQALRALLGRRDAQPLAVTLAEFHGVLVAPVAFVTTLRRERRLLRGFAAETGVRGPA